MTTYPGEPDAIIDLNATGNPPGPGAFVVRDDVTGNTLLSIETGGAGAGDLLHRGNLVLTGSTGRVQSMSGSLDLEAPAVRLGNGISWLSAVWDPAGAEMRLESLDNAGLSGAVVRLMGREPQGDADLVMVRRYLTGATSADDQDRLVVREEGTGSPPSEMVVATVPQTTDGIPGDGRDLRLRARSAAGQPVEILLDGETLMLENATASKDLLVEGALTAQADATVTGTLAAGAVAGPVTITGAQDLVFDDGTTSMRLERTGGDLTLREGGTELLTVSQSGGSSPTTALTTPSGTGLALTGSGVSVSGGSSMEALVEGGTARLRGIGGTAVVEAAGPIDLRAVTVEMARFRQGPSAAGARMELFGLGGAGAGPHITLLSDDGANTSSITVGENSTGLQGRILAEARTTGSPLPGLVGFQADDGTPIYLTAWALGGGQYELKVSVGAPASSADGKLVESLP